MFWLKKGSPYCPVPGNRGRGQGEVFQTLQWFSGKGRAFSNSSMVFGDRGEQNESIVFQYFPRLTPVAPVSLFLAFFKQKYIYFDSVKSTFFQQYHYCELSKNHEMRGPPVYLSEKSVTQIFLLQTSFIYVFLLFSYWDVNGKINRSLGLLWNVVIKSPF